jgi:hypothetical protein
VYHQSGKAAPQCVSKTQQPMKLNKTIAISESGLLFNPVTGESYSVNPIGIEILNLIRAEKDPDQISREILDKYSTDLITFEKDYQDFVGMLQHYKLLEKYDPTKA